MNSPFDRALREYGVHEVLGTGTNPRIGEYLKTVGQPSNDSVPWCSAFMNFCHDGQGTGKANARSWLDWGRPVIGTPEIGDVVVLWRNSKVGAKGHVGFFVRETASHVYLLGGNQNNEVCITRYAKDRVLGYRRAG